MYIDLRTTVHFIFHGLLRNPAVLFVPATIVYGVEKGGWFSQSELRCCDLEGKPVVSHLPSI